ncbi:MFS transporter [Alteromonas sp. C1M14]|nr:MFS transporter [Alteromonas sp. C1M14]MBU2980036.1 MFS transporter [Alteromonas sp. C1M14]
MASSVSSFSEFKEGWKIVLASTLGIGLGLSPVPFYTLGMLAPELSKEFGWGFGEIMTGLTISTLVVLFFSPIVGNLADRFGVRKVILCSVVMFSFSFALFAFGNGSLMMFYITWGIMAALGAGTLPITWTRGVNLWFERKKGLALGLSLIGTGLFGAMIKPVAAWMIVEFGWRMTYLAIAAMPLIVAFPIAFFCFYESPKTKSIAKKQQLDHEPVKDFPGLTMAEVFRDSKFWILCIAILPISFAVGGPIPNMENLLATKGFDTFEIASIVPLIGISVLFGRLIGGWLIDHFWAPGVAFILLSLPAAACWVLGTVELNMVIAMISVFMIGFAAGVEYDLLAFLIARYFGMKSYSTIYGFVYGAFALGAGIGPMTFGIIFDKTKSYDSIMIFSMTVMLIGATLLLLLGKYRDFSQPQGK